MSGDVLVTGVAGFIGYHVAERLLQRGESVIGVDNVNAYYDPRLKEARLDRLRGRDRFTLCRQDLADTEMTKALFHDVKPKCVVHLAAQAGVRFSLTDPSAYVSANVQGTLNVLEGCRHNPVKHLVYASSSSVYGANTRVPFSVAHAVDHPVSIYAASKKANELFAHSYSHLYGVPTTGLRFFTVYGPWGRPDMALFRFAEAILDDRPIEVYGRGEMWRDFTYIDDIVEGIICTLDDPAKPNPDWDGESPDPATSSAPYRLFNIGNNNPVKLTQLIEVLERALGRTARRHLLPMQPGDVRSTFADVESLQQAVGFRPSTSIESGVPRFVEWYMEWRGRAG